MRRFCLLALPFLVFASYKGFGQTSGCTVPAPQFQMNKPNIFNQQQEQWLGDAQAAQLEPEYELLPEKETGELTRIGNKLLAQLPPTTLKFTFRVYVDEEVNAFSIAGGHVYVSRKMISDAHNEDEIAGVVAHEIGHIYSRDMTVGVTRQLKALLNVTSLGDERDVEDKQQLLFNAPWKSAAGMSREEDSELAADAIGLYALTRAGYAPSAMAENLDRITDTKGHTGLFLKILSGESTETVDRIRAAHKAMNALSAECKAVTPGKSASFAEFQQKLRTQVPSWVVEPTPGLTSYLLDPPMRPGLDWIHFSPDGTLILAQTNASVHVLSRSPLKLLFTIDAPGAERAHFSPDSKRVSMAYPDMRVEWWDIGTQKRESVHDLIDYRGCWASALAPDGRTFACMKIEGTGVGLTLLDVETEKPVYENKKFNEFPAWGNRGDIVFSPDGTLMLALVGGKSFAYDLTERHEIAMHGDLGNMIAWKAAFVGNTKIAFACGNGKAQPNGVMVYTMCLDSFPGGDKLGKFPIGDQWVRGISQGDSVLVGPAGDNAAILIDPATGTIQRAFRLSQVDLYGAALASESAKGGVALKENATGNPVTVDLPIGPLTHLAAGDFSGDGRYLAYSHSSRGTLWDLEQHKQVSLLRPFSGLRFDDQDRARLHLITSFQKPGANLMLDAHTGTQTAGAAFEEDQNLLGGVLVNFKGLDKGSHGAVSNMEMQVSDPADGKQLWTRHFPKGKPGIYESDAETLVLMYDLRTDDADAELSHHKDKVVRSSDMQKEWLAEGLVLEIVNARTGEVQRILQTPTRPAGIFRTDHRWADVYGNYIAVHGNLNNTVVYRLSDGVRTAAFYGRVLGGDGAQGLLAVANRDQELTVYDAATGNAIKRVLLDHEPRVARFVASQKALLVLTATQRVYTIPLSSAPAAVTAAAK